MKRIISAGIIVFRKTPEGIKFLLLYHGRNYWNFAKGKVESEEKAWQAALRELREETGLKSTEIRFVAGFRTHERFTFQRGAEKVFKLVILYLAETKQTQITISDEHEGFGWFTYSEAKRALGKYKDSVKILDEAHGFLQRGRLPHRPRHPRGPHLDVQRGRGAGGTPPGVPGSRQHPQ